MSNKKPTTTCACTCHTDGKGPECSPCASGNHFLAGLTPVAQPVQPMCGYAGPSGRVCTTFAGHAGWHSDGEYRFTHDGEERIDVNAARKRDTTTNLAVASTAESRLMAEAFHQIIHFDEAKQYDKRNANVLLCMHYAQRLGYPVGIRMDPGSPEWPVVYIELPTGQVSWHLEQHSKPWDGHDTAAKYERCMVYSKAVYGA